MNKYLPIIILLFLVFLRVLTAGNRFIEGESYRLTDRVLQEPHQYDRVQLIKLQGVFVYLPRYPEVQYGDHIKVEGIYKGGKLTNATLVNLQQGGGIRNFRQNVVGIFTRGLPQPYSGLLAGITIGAKNALSNDFYELTKLTGTAHVVVASGTNITFFVSFLSAVLMLFMKRKNVILFVILGIVLYLFVAGLDPPLIRASVMSALILYSQGKGRLVSGIRILIITGFIMLFVVPEWLYDIGFLLSFASTCSLILFEARVRNYFIKLPALLREGISTSLAAQIGVGPILFVTFGQFNILSPFINALVLWTIPPIMVLGTLGALVGLIFPDLGYLILYLAYPLLWWFINILEFFK